MRGSNDVNPCAWICTATMDRKLFRMIWAKWLKSKRSGDQIGQSGGLILQPES